MSPLECLGLCKSFGDGELAERAVDGVSMKLRSGEAVILLGPSGSGKTTLLSMLGCMLRPTSGEMQLRGRPVDFRRAGELAALRSRELGFVFQHAQLLPFMDVGENLWITGENAGISRSELSPRIGCLLDRLDIGSVRRKRPAHLSGGQRQRVAIARALLHSPKVILADEPTAALDWTHGQIVADLLVQQARDLGAALLVVTHDTRLIPRFDRVIRMENGQIQELSREVSP